MIAWLIDTLVMTGALMALVLLVRRPVGRWFGPGAAYALWALPVIRLVMPPLALPQGLIPRFTIVAQQVKASASTLPAGADHTGLAMPAVQMQAGAMQDLATSSAEMAAPGLLSQIPWDMVVLAVWLAGAVAFLAWRAVSYQAMRRLLLDGARHVAQSGQVRIVETPATSVPLAFGVIDKIIALPVGFLADADSQTSDFAIAHELEHHAGYDLLALIALQPLFALHWFNPLGWAAWRALRSDQEAACDARVMAGRDRAERASYGRLIASFAGGSRLGLAASMAGPLAGDKPIVHRLKALARKDVTPLRRVIARSLFALAIVSVPATATVIDARTERADRTDEQTASMPALPAPPVAPAQPDAATASETEALQDVTDVSQAIQPFQAPQAREALAAPLAPRAPKSPIAPVALTAPPVPPVPPIPPMPPAAAAAARSVAYEARAEARAERAAAQASARAPKVVETVSTDGQRKTIRLTNSIGGKSSTQTMVLDESCPADAPQRFAAGARVICTGEPRDTRAVVLRALQSARASIAAERSLAAETKADILRDLDREIADAHREAAGA